MEGSSQEVIEKILGKDVIGYYFGTADTLSRNKFCTMYGWIFDDWTRQLLPVKYIVI